MAVHIRLARAGTKKRPFYRIVVTDERSPRGGRFLENIGTFDPGKEMKVVDGKTPLFLDQERYAHWTGRGAQPSETLRRVIKASAKASATTAK
ncbi:MAG: 30S ribosomal protein S16 [Labilithrix sp.]|nr:30S ribosomal protein S16 [Labilithrix sp.]MCW5813938.1 30S ribosomal protein S16 [Labilithrix sp.]